MPITSEGPHAALHRRFEGKTDPESQRELLNQEAALYAQQDYEAEKAERAMQVRKLICFATQVPLAFVTPETNLSDFGGGFKKHSLIWRDLSCFFSQMSGMEITITQAEICECETVGNLIELVEEKLSADQP